jgi:hypothetical protein
MLVVLASGADRLARDLVARWSAYGACLLTCSDLSTPSWLCYPGQAPNSFAGIGGRMIPEQEIDGVLTRLPGVGEHELAHIGGEDRAYVAAEMTAFLTAWLSALDCPVLNRPRASSLLAPSWRHEQWVYAAAQLGIPVRPVRRTVTLRGGAGSEFSQSTWTTMTVVGERCVGDGDEVLASRARRLAAAARVDLLTVHFEEGLGDTRFVCADPVADLSTDRAADAVLEYLQRGRARAA